MHWRRAKKSKALSLLCEKRNSIMAAYSRGQNELVTCPYNPAHRVLRQRLQLHLAKCKKDHLDSNIEVCPFNAVHRLPKHLMKDHIAKCDSRLVIDKKLATDPNDTFKGRTAVPSYNQPVPPCDEYWDDEMTSGNSYIPEVNNLKGQLVLDLGFTKPAERKKLYQSLHQVQVDNKNGGTATMNNNNDIEAKPKSFSNRQPHQNYKESCLLKTEKEQPFMGLGRGAVKTERRIAANIFGGGEDFVTMRQPEPVHQAVAAMSKLNIGLGRGVRPSSSLADFDRDFPPL